MGRSIFRVYRGMPFSYHITKDRYWDENVRKSILVDSLDEVTLEAYPGVEISENNSVITLKKALLPNRTEYKGYRGIFALEGNEYLWCGPVYRNFVTKGSVYSDEITGEVERFYSDSYVDSPEAAPDCEYFDCTVKAFYDGDEAEQCLLSTTSSAFIGFSGGKLGLYQASWNLNETELATGTYWFRAIYDNTNANQLFYLYYLTDNEGVYRPDTLPALQYWHESLALCECENMFKAQTISLGRSGSSYWHGKIFANTLKVMTADGVWWTAEEEDNFIFPGILSAAADDGTAVWNAFYSYEAQTTELSTADVISSKTWIGQKEITPSGTPKIYKLNYNYNGSMVYDGCSVGSFGAASYIVSKSKLPVLAYFPQVVDYVTNVVTGEDTNNRWFLFVTNGGSSGLGTTTGNQWLLRSSGTDNAFGSFSYNTKYWVRFVQNLSGYAFYYMLDDGTYELSTLPDVSDAAWTEGFVAESGMFFSNTGLALGCNYEDMNANYAWSGKIDLAKTMLRTRASNSSIWSVFWQPLSAV